MNGVITFMPLPEGKLLAHTSIYLSDDHDEADIRTLALVVPRATPTPDDYWRWAEACIHRSYEDSQ